VSSRAVPPIIDVDQAAASAYGASAVALLES